MLENWVLWAILSMIFAGFTSVIAKLGLVGISGDLGLAIRTMFVFVFVLIFAAVVVPRAELAALTPRNYLFLGLSGVTTSLSWIFYYRAIKAGNVATVALIDKGSVVVAMFLAWLVLREQITPKMMGGASLIVAGIFVIAKR
jgi:bacterial/archaeal transporter family protein